MTGAATRAPFFRGPRRRAWLRGALSAALALALPVAVRGAAAEEEEEEEDAPRLETLNVAGARLDLQFAPGFDAALRSEATAWVQRSAFAVAGYFGRFPVARAELLIVPVDGAGVKGGTAYAEPELYLRLRVGRETRRDHFFDDWIMVHEMVHLAIPRVPRAQNWLHEGLATYVEGVARVRAGLTQPEQLWRELMQGLPHGQPQAGDRGLDHTPTWGRTYWGGATFCLLADLQIRRRSAQRLGRQQALQGVLAAGGHYGRPWPLARVLATADQAVGQTTLTELHGLMKECPAPVDLDALWQDLGVARRRFGGVRLDDGAPLAAARRAILQS